MTKGVLKPDQYDYETFQKIYYADREYFSNREFSFTLAGDVYTRYRSFNSKEAFHKELSSSNPNKIDIGAVYNAPPNKRELYAKSFAPKEKELVFDIDMTDYDDVRTCCSDANICRKCWVFMTISIKIVNRILTDEFGFKHVMWVYSGRRGIHCWVCDVRARRLSQEARRAIADYITVVKSGDKNSKKVNLGPQIHPSQMKSFKDVLEPFFTEQLLEQQMLMSEGNREKILDLIQDDAAKAAILKAWSGRNNDTPQQIWSTLKQTLPSDIRGRRIHDIIFTYSYPRLDVHVSVGLNHLLKSPFCIHPKTGRVCVPIDPEKCEEFDPTSVPDLYTLVEQLRDNRPIKKKDGKEVVPTDLDEHVKFFSKKFVAPLKAAIQKEKAPTIKDATDF
ncbi:DNA primase small subunit-like [Planoprotostelium fungivorum]|uniref:DNA primase n=1 Tax=Planoprotostelium fungivorum TaxID=1890364 RepID=A0A2P6MP02_9EUKA|nr:DNA primase small subunit-like [Planoprotostelium fungivorum]